VSKVFDKLHQGYLSFREAYASGKHSLMKELSEQGQNPEVMVVACSDSRVDPALLL
jgi:carbonic anhydrase